MPYSYYCCTQGAESSRDCLLGHLIGFSGDVLGTSHDHPKLMKLRISMRNAKNPSLKSVSLTSQYPKLNA